MNRRAGWTWVLCVACVGQVCHAENWPSWRGPAGNGVSSEKHLAIHWSPTQNVAWKAPLPGQAGATPVVWDEHIFLTSVDADNNLLLLAFRTDGQELWRKVISTGNQVVRGGEGNYASPSPVTDGRHVWSLMGNGELACYTVSGQKTWQFNVQERFGKLDIAFGLTSTPVLDGGVLYLQLIHGDGNVKTREACVVALDAATGKTMWRVDRPSDGYAENEHSYASPMLYDDGQRRFLLTHGCDYIVAHDLKDGREIWRCGNLNRKNNYDPTLRFVASPVTAPGIIVVPSAKRGPVLALKPTGRGDISANPDYLLWELKRTPDVPSPLIVEDRVYLCLENGDLMIVDRHTGRELDYQRTERDRHRASPVYADGHIYLTARSGKVTVVKAGDQVQIVAQNDLGEEQSASPAISNGTIYLRTFQHLWAIRPSK
uniref:Pyrrolo-quinoline quinone n=1 Tax=Schlesneria paludicola TaxID=360056 RepID=A0A7C4QMF6_9PLAN